MSRSAMFRKAICLGLICKTSIFWAFLQLRSAKALYALVSEFGSTRATALGLPLEFFRITHSAFDKVGLDQVHIQSPFKRKIHLLWFICS